MKRALLILGLFVLCCCQTSSGTLCCGEVDLCGPFIPGCICS